MARFYGELQGSRGRASRLGTLTSGLQAHIRGWDIGVKVFCATNAAGKDEITVWRTGGSNAPGAQEIIALVTAKKEN